MRPAYVPQGALRALFSATDPEILVEGPSGTGKSRAILERWHQLALTYAGARGLILRKTLTSLAGSGLETYRRDVLPGSGVIFFGGNRVEPPAYRYPNGSELRLGSLHTTEAVERVKSTDYDWIYPQEATELVEGDYEMLTTRLRSGFLPFQQIVADANPAWPSHWLNQRAGSGRMRRIHSRHDDNPRYWDAAARAWTPEGERYVLGVLDRLGGVRRERLRFGRWVAAEGQVYETWDPKLHLLTEGEASALGFLDADGGVNWEVVRAAWGAVDWGYTNAGILQVWLEDGDGRLCRAAEVYQTGRLDDWWRDQALALSRRFRVRDWFCDPSEPAYIAKFRAAGLSALPGRNDVHAGIQAVQKRLATGGDGRPRLYVIRADPELRDPALVEAHLPASLEQEIEAYVWQPGREEPVKSGDHALDAARYVCYTLELRSRGGDSPRTPDGQGQREYGMRVSQRQFGRSA